MAINNQRISCSELDFTAIKENFKTYLQGQSTFTDYDLEGSGMSVLLDVLAYNTHYRGLYDNFMINEMFLDSASKRSNIVSRAKEIGYTPSSIKAPKAHLKVIVADTTNGPDLLVLPKLTSFNTTANGSSYSFKTLQAYSTMKVGNTYTFDDVIITEGQYLTSRFNVTDGSKYILPNVNIDTDTMSVMIQDNNQSNVYTTFRLSNEIVGVSATDRVYWIKEIDGGLYELEFGNNVIGLGLINGNVVHIEYMVTHGTESNGTSSFKYSGGSLYGATPNPITIVRTSGGANGESSESIKFNAPRFYSTQNRAVTVDDYRNLIYNLVPEAQAVNVWSGADNNPPEYGKVFICIKPKTIEKFTNIEKVSIKADIIKSKNVVSVIPEIIDPQYIKIEVVSNVYFDPASTIKSPNDIKLEVENTIAAYNASDLQRFDSVLRFSKLTRLIDETNTSIISNITSITIHRSVVPKLNINANYTVNLINPIHPELIVNAKGDITGEPSVQSTGFYTAGSYVINYMSDNGEGVMQLYTMENGIKTIIREIGTVDYGRGIITINNLYISSVVGDTLDFVVKPASYDVVSILDQLVIIPTNLIKVNIITDLSFGASGGGTNYTFSSSRS